MTEQEITLTEILTAREERVAIQNALLAEYKAPVISFTMNTSSGGWISSGWASFRTK